MYANIFGVMNIFRILCIYWILSLHNKNPNHPLTENKLLHCKYSIQYLVWKTTIFSRNTESFPAIFLSNLSKPNQAAILALGADNCFRSYVWACVFNWRMSAWKEYWIRAYKPDRLNLTRNDLKITSQRDLQHHF